MKKVVTVRRTAHRFMDVEVDVRDEVAKHLTGQELDAVAEALALDKAPGLEFPAEKESEYEAMGVTDG